MADIPNYTRIQPALPISEVKIDGLVNVTIQSRVARNKFCCGLGVRAVRAGSIGRDDPRLEENTASPKWGAGGLGPHPLHEDPSAVRAP
jgi:hypothetical protein